METAFEKQDQKVKGFERLKESWEILSGQELIEKDIPVSEFLVENLVPLASITILSGKPCSFKSWVLLLIAKQVALGKDLFGEFETKQRKVLYVDEESSLAEQKRRWLLMKDSEPTPVHFSSMVGFKIDNKTQREFLLEICKENDYKVLIIDSLRDVHSLNENDSKDAQSIINGFREFTNQGITVLISHHNRKESFLNPKDPSQMLRGSDAFLAGLDTLLAVENPEATEESAELIITQAKLRQGRKIDPFKVGVYEKEGKIVFEYLGKLDTEESKLEKAKEAVKDLLKEQGELYQTQIIERLGALYYKPKTIRRAIAELFKEKEISPRVVGVKTFYTLSG